MLKIFRRWQRNRAIAKELRENCLAVMGYRPEYCFRLMVSGQAMRRQRREG